MDKNHNPVRGAHRVMAFTQDMLRMARLVRLSKNYIEIGLH